MLSYPDLKHYFLILSRTPITLLQKRIAYISDQAGVFNQQIMQKVFALLLAELRKLRATIVFADFSRIIIATGKYNMAAAQGYCEYLLKTLKSRYIFYLNP